MKRKHPVALILLCAAVLLLFAGCQTPPDPTQPPPETTESTAPPETEPQFLLDYRAAVEKLAEAPSVTLTVTSEKVTTVAGEKFEEKTRQTLKCSQADSDAPSYESEESCSYGSYGTSSFHEILVGDTVYLNVDEELYYTGTIDTDQAASRYLPAALLTEALYGDVVLEGSAITFSQPTEAESWAMPEGAEFLQASGAVTLDDEGQIKKYTYTISYRMGAAEVSVETTAYVSTESVTVSPPEDQDQYITLTSIDAPKLAIAAIKYLNQANTYSAQTSGTVISQAGAAVETQSVTVHTHYKGGEFLSWSENNISTQLYNTNESYNYTLQETYIDDVYSYSENGAESVTVPGVTKNQLREIYQDSRDDSFVNLSAWQDASITQINGMYLIELTLSEECGNSFEDTLCQYFWEDPAFLDNLATAYVNNEVTAYIGIDGYTGLPTSAGCYYQGTHTIDGADYLLSSQLDKSFQIPSLNAYYEITEEHPEESAPEVAPTPLFYHVTGEDGQEMWLFGTIHVGDERTAFLPQQIYDAFTASDALALEFDAEAFEARLEEDAALQAQVSGCYFYTDGSTAADYLYGDLYEQAVRYLKLSGSYNMNSAHMKPSIWCSAFDNFHLQLGYQLTSHQGLETRLTELAKAQNKPIRDVESGLSQIQMLTGWSDKLQELLLEESLRVSPAEYAQETSKLYELWCAGDEAALREMLSDQVDTSTMTEDELAEYNEMLPYLDEYNKGMSYDRNDAMLQVAISYLESGETVFYAVGLAHLLNGTNGLVDTLREAGYTVELVSFS